LLRRTESRGCLSPPKGYRLAVPVSLAVLVMVVISVGSPRALASSGEGTAEPKGRGLQLLGGREAILLEQSERARRTARARARAFYQLLRLVALERGGGAALATGQTDDRLGGRAIALAATVLERDLREASLLRAELDRVRAERVGLDFRSSIQEVPPGMVSATTSRPAVPAFVPPVTGDVVIPFGVGRDPATGAWIFRAAASFATHGAESVRSPAEGRVVRVATSVAGGAAVVIAHAQGRWTSVTSGLGSVAVASGELVGPGDILGTSRDRQESTIRIETWRGRTPIDPALVLRAR
jgi:murein DD-endopeptidase MepM/ murein hydrolase activator NlpD